MSEAVRIGCADTTAVVLPSEGGVAAELIVSGRSILARTPWAEGVPQSDEPAPDEDAWVRRWRGGWQACLPTSGMADPRAAGQSFHGEASQTPWTVRSRGDDRVRLSWSDGRVRAERRWRATTAGLVVTGQIVNVGTTQRPVAVAEHLVLDVVAFRGGGAAVDLFTDTAARVRALDYDGTPTGDDHTWADAGWGRVTPSSGPRVAGLVGPRPTRVRVAGQAMSAVIEWTGLPHALLWDEDGQSREHPWDGSVHALGIEPTTTPHGAGTAAGDSPSLAPAARLRWRVELRVDPREKEST